MVLHAELQAEVVEAEHDLIDTRHREDVSKAHCSRRSFDQDDDVSAFRDQTNKHVGANEPTSNGRQVFNFVIRQTRVFASLALSLTQRSSPMRSTPAWSA